MHPQHLARLTNPIGTRQKLFCCSALQNVLPEKSLKGPKTSVSSRGYCPYVLLPRVSLLMRRIGMKQGTSSAPLDRGLSGKWKSNEHFKTLCGDCKAKDRCAGKICQAFQAEEDLAELGINFFQRL